MQAAKRLLLALELAFVLSLLILSSNSRLRFGRFKLTRLPASEFILTPCSVSLSESILGIYHFEIAFPSLSCYTLNSVWEGFRRCFVSYPIAYPAG